MSPEPRELVKYDHVSVSRKGKQNGPIDTVLKERYGLSRRIALVVPTYYSLIESMKETDVILPLPEIVTDRLPLASLGLKTFSFPFKLPPVRAFQAWHPRVDADPLHRWFRNTVYFAIREEQDRLIERTKGDMNTKL